MVKDLAEKNEQKRKKLEAFRKSQQETEAAVKRKYRNLQEVIHQTIIERKEDDMMRHRKRSSAVLFRSESSKMTGRPRKDSENKEFEYFVFAVKWK